MANAVTVVTKDVRVPVVSDKDIVAARQQGRGLAAELGLSLAEQTAVATAISEIARNIVQHTKGGEVLLSLIQSGGKRGIRVVARDDGPGIQDIQLAMQDGYSTVGGLGMGLPGARRLMDEFDIVSEPRKGTTVTMKKWAR